MKIKAVKFAVALLFAAATVASAQDANMGTWKLNEAKSRFAKGDKKSYRGIRVRGRFGHDEGDRRRHGRGRYCHP